MFYGAYLEPRVDISLDVKVWGMDLYGKPFVQHARTVNASSVGARLIGIDCVREGEVISLQHENQKARCKVVWVGRDAAKSRQIGIQVVEPDKKLFGAKLKAPAATDDAVSFPLYRVCWRGPGSATGKETYARTNGNQKGPTAFPLHRRR